MLKRAFLVIVAAVCVTCSTMTGTIFGSDDTSLALNQAFDGQVCLLLHYPDPDPAVVRLLRDGEEVVYYRRGIDIIQPPKSVCLPTEDITPGPHKYTLEVTSDSDVATAHLTVITHRSDFGLKRAIPSQLIYQKSQEVVLDIDAGADGVDIKSDFLPLDSAYRAGAETLERLGGGRYRIHYKLSPQNKRPADVYPITLELAKGSKRQAVPKAVELTYLPRGRTHVLARGGRFIPEDMSQLKESTGFTIIEAALNQPKRETTKGQERKIDPRRPFELVAMIRSSLPLQTDEIDLDLVDRRHDGFLNIPVKLNTIKCRSDGCTYLARVTLHTDLTSASHLPQIDLALRAVSKGAATTVFPVPGFRLKAQDFEHTHEVHGIIHFEYRKLIPNYLVSTSLANWPQYASVTEVVQERSLRWANLVLEDECGHFIQGKTDDMGQFSFAWTPVGCENATITAWSVAEGFNRNAAVGKWKQGPVNSICKELTGNTEDYIPYSYTQNFTISAADLKNRPNGLPLEIAIPESNTAAKGFYILDNGVRALEYYDDIQGVSTLPKLNFVYSPGLKPANWAEQDDDCDDSPNDNKNPDGKWDGTWARYIPSKDPGFIFIPAEPDDYGWNAFAHIHETSHYFQRHYLRSTDYGRIGEPLANAQAAAIRSSAWMITPLYAESIDVNAHYEDRDNDGASEFWQADMTFGKIDNDDDGLFDEDPKDGENNDEDGLVDEDPVDAVAQGWHWRILWDLIDAGASESEPLKQFIPETGGNPVDFGQFDQYAGGGGDQGNADADNHKLNNVLIGYLGGGVYGTQNPNYEDREVENVDLVDMLDGMICRNQITQEEMEGIVNNAMAYDYDYGGPTSCDDE